MLRKFKISIDGTQYLVEMEEVGPPTPTGSDAVTVPAPAPATPAPAPTSTPAPAPASAPQPETQPAAAPTAAGAAAPSQTPAGAHEQAAPMPGKILDILLKVGDTVDVNQPVLILEAMKMESQIVAEQAGTIASINVEKGVMVNPGDPLFSIA